jgi:hypothetical protein
MVPVTVTVRATDASGIASTKIISVSSDESGKKQFQITRDLTVDLQADRKGKGDGRTYTITVQVADPFNNKATGIVLVTVPHNQPVR